MLALAVVLAIQLEPVRAGGSAVGRVVALELPLHLFDRLSEPAVEVGIRKNKHSATPCCGRAAEIASARRHDHITTLPGAHL
jgi:hypothetical protein